MISQLSFFLSASPILTSLQLTLTLSLQIIILPFLSLSRYRENAMDFLQSQRAGERTVLLHSLALPVDPGRRLVDGGCVLASAHQPTLKIPFFDR